MAMRQVPVAGATPLYPHEYLIAEDEMGESAAQDLLLKYLVAVLDWLLEREGWYVARNLTMFHPAIENSQNLISPDIAVFLGIPLTAQEKQELTSWDMVRNPGKPCPPVMIEVSSSGTWQSDVALEQKPRLYGLMGAQEYFAYDPAGVWRRQGIRRLLGWRYDVQGKAIPLEPHERGWLWSTALDSWLVPDGFRLRLYDRQEQRRLTEAEAAAMAQQEAIAEAWTVRQQAEIARQQAEIARQQAEIARQQAETARQQAEQETWNERMARQDIEARLARWREKLRQQGIDPDSF